MWIWTLRSLPFLAPLTFSSSWFTHSLCRFCSFSPLGKKQGPGQSLTFITYRVWTLWFPSQIYKGGLIGRACVEQALDFSSWLTGIHSQRQMDGHRGRGIPRRKMCGAGKTVKSSLLGHFSNFSRSNFLAWEMEIHTLILELTTVKSKEDGTSLMV